MELKRNKKAYFDYEHLETFEAGIVLTGAEVKSVKTGLVNLEGAFVRIKDGEAWITNMKIGMYPKASSQSKKDYVTDRPRKLLLTKKEMLEIVGKMSGRGLTVVPLFVYSSRRLVKVRIALARGKRKFDKRKAIKDKEFKRRLETRVK